MCGESGRTCGGGWEGSENNAYARTAGQKGGGNTMGDARVRGVLGQGRRWYGDHGAPIDTPADTILIFLSCA